MLATQTEVPVDNDIMDLVPGFREARKVDLVKLETCISNRELDEVRRLSHSIRGVASSYGYPTLGLLLEDLEEACKASDVSKMTELKTLIHQYAKVYFFSS
jgi:hypothetical protein